MDQLRTALAWLKRQHFWVLSVLVAFIALGCWWSASRKLRAQYEANQKTITAEFNNLQTLRSTPFHPNTTINERQTTETKKQAENVAKIWQVLYDRQREQVLQWPAALSKAFRDYVEKKQFGDDIPSHLRDNYQNYVELHFPELPKKIKARVLQVGETGGLGEMRGRTFSPEMQTFQPGVALADDDDYICQWLDQGFVRDELNFPQQPSSIQIWVTQEDLWVYHTLLDVIDKTNQAAGATRMSNAAVKTIQSLQVGIRAAQYSRRPGRLAVAPAMASALGPGMGPEGAGPSPERGVGPEAGPGPRREMDFGSERRFEGGPGGAATTPEQESAMLLSYRYLDDKGMPIAAGGAAAGGEGVPPEAAPSPDAAAPATPIDLKSFGTEYKRLPVRMVLEMDGRWLPQLISACANQSLRVEVQEVRINPSDGGGVEGGFGGGGGFRSFGEGGSGRGSAGANLFPDRTGLQTFQPQPNVVNVVIQGIIYIFNKPDLKVLEPPADAQMAGM